MAQDGPNKAPREPQGSSSGLQRGPRRSQNGPSGLQEGPQESSKRELRPKLARGPLQDGPSDPEDASRQAPEGKKSLKIIWVFHDFDDSAVSRHKSNLGQKKAPMGSNLSPSLGHPLAVLFQFAPLGLPKRSRTASKTAHEGQNCASCWLTAPKMAAYCPRWFPRSLQDGPPRLQDGPWDPQDASGRAPEGQNH